MKKKGIVYKKKTNKNSDAIPCGWRHYESGIVTVSRRDSVTIFKYVSLPVSFHCAVAIADYH